MKHLKQEWQHVEISLPSKTVLTLKQSYESKLKPSWNFQKTNVSMQIIFFSHNSLNKFKRTYPHVQLSLILTDIKYSLML